MFFSEIGECIDNNSFLETYSAGYFAGKNCKVDLNYSQQSEYVENSIIMPILYKGMLTKSDFVRALAWKIGKIKQSQSEECRKIVYYKGWENSERIFEGKLYNDHISLDNMASFIVDNRIELEKLALNDPQICLNELRKNCCRRIGSVYLLAIIFFLSHGYWPIYDRFVHASIFADERDLIPSKMKDIEIIVPSLPIKSDDEFDVLFDKYFLPYVDKIKSLANRFDIDYKKIED